jgi:broad specificity phosphatase PhoE
MGGTESTILWLVRAGETAWQRDERIQGRTDLPMSAEARSAISADLARFLGALSVSAGGEGAQPTGEARTPLSAILHPDDDSARETAEILARALGGRARVVAELAEPELGLLSGLTMEQFAERFPTRHRQWEDEPLSMVPPEGEAMVDARRRLFEALGRQARKFSGCEFAVVLHPIALGLTRCALEARESRDVWSSLEGRQRLERYLLPGDVQERLRGMAETA